MPRRAPLRRTWYRALGVGPVLLLATFLPSVTYVDHWVEYANHALGTMDPVQEAQEHADHCHYGPSSCSQQPTAVDVRVVPSVVEVPLPVFPRVLQDEPLTVLEEFIAATPTEPPRV